MSVWELQPHVRANKKEGNNAEQFDIFSAQPIVVIVTLLSVSVIDALKMLGPRLQLRSQSATAGLASAKRIKREASNKYVMLSPAIWRAVTNQIEIDVATAAAASLLKLCHR